MSALEPLPAAVLWDMDDTLLNTLPGRMRALSHAFEICLGRRVDPLEEWRKNQGATLEALSIALMGDEWRRFADAYRDYYYEQPREYAPFDGIVEALDHYAAAHVPMAVVTSKIAHGAIDELEASGLLRYFGAVVCFDDTDLHKPEPDPIYEALDRLLITDERRVAFVGDSPADMLAARRSGCRPVAALWGTLDRDQLLAAGPDFAAQTPGQVRTLLASPAGRPV